MADLQNYRKQVEKERKDFAAFANVMLLVELLPILDSFNRAFSQVPEEIKKQNGLKARWELNNNLPPLCANKELPRWNRKLAKHWIQKYTNQ